VLVGGADGIRTHDLLDAIEARSQLRHGPTAKLFSVYHNHLCSDLPPERLAPGFLGLLGLSQCLPIRYVTAVLNSRFFIHIN
jgi:hypothetical protein